MVRRGVRGLALGACAIGVAGLLGGCSITDRGDNVVNGKQLFVERCGSCHILNRAGTKGVVGPNLDAAFQRARADGFGDSTFAGMVHRQILQPPRRADIDPKTGKPQQKMPANIVTGDDARDVAAYVASAVGKGGEDQGALANIGGGGAEGTARARNGTLEIPADPGGGLFYEFADAQAPPGALKIDSPNEATVDHNIALEGSGVNEIGPVVNNGGVSTINVDVQAGEYQFYCSVPGHREAGMEGTLTVEG